MTRAPRSDVVLRRFMRGESLTTLAAFTDPLWARETVPRSGWVDRYRLVQDALRRAFARHMRKTRRKNHA